MSTQHFFLRDKYLGSRPIETYAEAGSGMKIQNSYALFCPNCAAIWAKLMHEHSGSYCQPLTSRCLAHAEHWTDATFTESEGRMPLGARSWSDDLPYAVKAYDVLALTTFWFNHPDKRWMTLHLS